MNIQTKAVKIIYLSDLGVRSVNNNEQPDMWSDTLIDSYIHHAKITIDLDVDCKE